MMQRLVLGPISLTGKRALRTPLLARSLAYQGAPGAIDKTPIKAENLVNKASDKDELKRVSQQMKGSGIPDKEAAEQEMEQVSQQMEDAIVKEKEVHDTEQAAKTQSTWDIDGSSQKLPTDDLSKQSKTPEMSSILKEQQKLAEQEAVNGQGKNFDREKSNANYDSSSGTNMMDTMKHSMSDAGKTVQELGHDLKEATKKSMSDLKDMAKGMMSSTPPSEQKNDAKIANPQHGGEPKDDEIKGPQDSDDKNKPRSKQFSEHRQNSSLL